MYVGLFPSRLLAGFANAASLHDKLKFAKSIDHLELCVNGSKVVLAGCVILFVLIGVSLTDGDQRPLAVLAAIGLLSMGSIAYWSGRLAVATKVSKALRSYPIETGGSSHRLAAQYINIGRPGAESSYLGVYLQNEIGEPTLWLEKLYNGESQLRRFLPAETDLGWLEPPNCRIQLGDFVHEVGVNHQILDQRYCVTVKMVSKVSEHCPGDDGDVEIIRRLVATNGFFNPEYDCLIDTKSAIHNIVREALRDLLEVSERHWPTLSAQRQRGLVVDHLIGVVNERIDSSRVLKAWIESVEISSTAPTKDYQTIVETVVEELT